MITTINFHNKLFLQTNKIYNTISYHMLTTELLSQIITTQHLPHSPFRFRRMVPIIRCITLQNII